MGANVLPRQWRATVLIMGVVLCGLLLWYWKTAFSIVNTWSHSGTYAHGFLIIPISAWLVWQKRGQLARLTPAPSLLPLWIIGGLGMLWLLAHSVEVLVVQQLCLVAMLITALVSLLGWRVARTIAFPIGFLFFAVPMGEDLIPPMMRFTADFTVKALQLTGIPVLREGTYITLPNGQWQVAAACSGVRYLIASVTLGCLYAYLMYTSYRKRLIFIAISAMVPVVANGIRAYMIVMIGYLSGMKLATGVDHIIYGWIFFGVVIGILFFIGAIWREDIHAGHGRHVMHGGPAQTSERGFPYTTKALKTGLGLLCVGLVWPALSLKMGGASRPVVPIHLSAPSPIAGWQLSKDQWDWHPRYLRPQGQVRQMYASASGLVGLYLEYYRDQRQGAELIDSQNVLVYEHDKQWRYIGSKRITINLAGGPVRIRQSYLDSQNVRLLVWQWNWIAGHVTINPYVGKLLEAKDKILRDGTQSAAVILAADYDITPNAAKARLARFVRDMYPEIEKTLNSGALVATHGVAENDAMKSGRR